MSQSRALPEQQLVSVRVAASMLGLHENSVRAGIHRGTIPCVRLTPRKFMIPLAWLDATVQAPMLRAAAQ